jgi:hypothetical protein
MTLWEWFNLERTRRSNWLLARQYDQESFRKSYDSDDLVGRTEAMDGERIDYLSVKPT